MGFKTEQFVEKVDENLKCSICLDVLEDPWQCRDGHTFCKDCITLCLEDRQICPVGNNPLKHNSLVRNLVVKNMVEDLQVYCHPPKSDGQAAAKIDAEESQLKCDWTGKLQSLAIHRETCPFQQVQCPNVGCNTNFQRRELEDHDKICEYKEVRCDEKCGEILPKRDLPDHKRNDCPEVRLPCPNDCWTSIKRKNITTHRETCPFQRVQCPNVGCNTNMQRRELEDHDKICVYKKVECQECGEVLVRLELPVHENEDCPEEMFACQNSCRSAETGQISKIKRDDCVDCPFKDQGCLVQVEQQHVDQHVQENMAAHMMLLAKQCSSLSKQNLSLFKENKQLKEELNQVKEELNHLKTRPMMMPHPQTPNQQMFPFPSLPLGMQQMIQMSGSSGPPPYAVTPQQYAQPKEDKKETKKEEQEEKAESEEETWEDKDEKSEEGLWSPEAEPEENKNGRRVYDRDFLLQFQFHPVCTEKPEGLPDIEVVLKTPVTHRPQMMKQPFSRMGGSGGVDFMMPSYMRQRGQGKPGQTMASRSNKGRIPAKKDTIEQKVELNKCENRWVRQREALKTMSEEEKKHNEFIRKFRGILNKLTPQKFSTLIQQVLDLEIDTAERLEEVINNIFENAISEPSFSVAYAKMCRCLVLTNVKVETKDGKDTTLTFRKILLNKCQKEFEKKKSDEISIHKKMDDLLQQGLSEEELKIKKEELDLEEQKGRRRTLGNFRFIGELFKLKMLTESIMHDLIINLLESNDEESYECLCKLLSTIGKDLDHQRAKGRIDLYFDQINKKIESKKTSSRCRFMLQDVIELRLNNWVPRRDDINPKSIDQIHEEAAEAKESQDAKKNLESLASAGWRSTSSSQSRPPKVRKKAGKKYIYKL